MVHWCRTGRHRRLVFKVEQIIRKPRWLSKIIIIIIIIMIIIMIMMMIIIIIIIMMIIIIMIIIVIIIIIIIMMMRERNVLFNDALNTFYLRLYGVRHMVKDHSDSEKGNPLPPHRLLLLINSKGSFICTIPQTG